MSFRLYICCYFRVNGGLRLDVFVVSGLGERLNFFNTTFNGFAKVTRTRRFGGWSHSLITDLDYVVSL
jgi:hypothetical protein